MAWATLDAWLVQRLLSRREPSTFVTLTERGAADCRRWGDGLPETSRGIEEDARRKLCVGDEDRQRHSPSDRRYRTARPGKPVLASVPRTSLPSRFPMNLRMLRSSQEYTMMPRRVLSPCLRLVLLIVLVCLVRPTLWAEPP